MPIVRLRWFEALRKDTKPIPYFLCVPNGGNFKLIFQLGVSTLYIIVHLPEAFPLVVLLCRSVAGVILY